MLTGCTNFIENNLNWQGPSPTWWRVYIYGFSRWLQCRAVPSKNLLFAIRHTIFRADADKFNSMIEWDWAMWQFYDPRLCHLRLNFIELLYFITSHRKSKVVFYRRVAADAHAEDIRYKLHTPMQFSRCWNRCEAFFIQIVYWNFNFC